MALTDCIRPLRNALLRVMRVEVTEDEKLTASMTVPVLWAAAQELNHLYQEERLKRRALEKRVNELEARLVKAGI